MAQVHFITHPEVAIDPSVPVPDWPLSARGLARTQAMLARPWLTGIGALFSSEERKARDMAAILARHLNLGVTEIEGLGENDRSATGYLPPAEFEATADAFFAHPAQSIRGWERAMDAQARIVAAVDRALSRPGLGPGPGPGDVAIIAHGGVGALLLCHLRGVPISRALDQPGAGGGNLFTFDAATRTPLSGWRRIEDD